MFSSLLFTVYTKHDIFNVPLNIKQVSPCKCGNLPLMCIDVK